MTVFVENPADYLGESVTVEHFIPPYPYGPVFLHGIRAWPDDDESLRDAHVAEFPITGGLYDGYEVGGRP